MKTVGKITTLAASLSLSFVLAACGGSSSSSSASSSASSASDSAAASSVSSETTSSVATSASSSSSVDLSQATTYENEAFGIKYDLPEGWKFTDAASLAETSSVIRSAASSSAIDMVATNADNTTNVILAVIDPSEETAGKSAEDFLKAQTDAMQEGLEGNFSYVSDEAEITFNGIDRKLPAMLTTITENGKTLVVCQAVAEKDGHYLNFLSVGTTKDDVLDSFSSFRSVA